MKKILISFLLFTSLSVVGMEQMCAKHEDDTFDSLISSGEARALLQDQDQGAQFRRVAPWVLSDDIQKKYYAENSCGDCMGTYCLYDIFCCKGLTTCRWHDCNEYVARESYRTRLCAMLHAGGCVGGALLAGFILALS